MAYDRRNPIYAVGKRAYDLAVTQNNRRGKNFIRNYERVMRVASSMQERLAAKGNSKG